VSAWTLNFDVADNQILCKKSIETSLLRIAAQQDPAPELILESNCRITKLPQIWWFLGEGCLGWG